jgi:large subunit ribosomal protein L32
MGLSFDFEFMGVPKRKPSHSRQRQRRAYNSVMKLPQVSTCPQCASPYVPHRACPACGFYKGRQVLTVESAG